MHAAKYTNHEWRLSNTIVIHVYIVVNIISLHFSIICMTSLVMLKNNYTNNNTSNKAKIVCALISYQFHHVTNTIYNVIKKVMCFFHCFWACVNRISILTAIRNSYEAGGRGSTAYLSHHYWQVANNNFPLLHKQQNHAYNVYPMQVCAKCLAIHQRLLW